MTFKKRVMNHLIKSCNNKKTTRYFPVVLLWLTMANMPVNKNIYCALIP